MGDNKNKEQEVTSEVTFHEALKHFDSAYSNAENQFDKLNLKLWRYVISIAYVTDWNNEAEQRKVVSYETFCTMPLLPKIEIIKKGVIDVADLEDQSEDYLIKLLTTYSGRLT